MPTNILYKDDEMLQQNDAIYGTNRVRYIPWINRIISSETNHSNGKLGELSVKEVHYNLTQKFPSDDLATVLKASATEFSQANAHPTEFVYNKVVRAVEFVMSNMKSANMSNVEAGIVNELNKQYDTQGYSGMDGNTGVENNPNKVDADAPVVANDIDGLMKAITEGRRIMKEQLGIVDGDFKDVLVGYTSKVSGILDLKSGDVTGRKMVSDTFPLETMEEMPKFVSGANDYLEFYYKPMLKMHHGASPSKYNTESGKHGLSSSSLFVFESVGIEGEAKGCIVRVPLTIA